MIERVFPKFNVCCFNLAKKIFPCLFASYKQPAGLHATAFSKELEKSCFRQLKIKL